MALVLAAGAAQAAAGPAPAPQATPPSQAAPPAPARPSGRPLFDPRRPPEQELQTSIADGFTLAAVGDCIISRSLTPMLKRDGAFAAVVKILRDADATFGNFENSAIDIRGFKGHPQGGADDWALVAAPAVAGDLKAMGFDLLGRANNHAMDWGVEGMRETGRWLDEAGLVHAGAGESRAEARAARYFESEQGRIALVSFASTYVEMSAALPPSGQAPARPGLSTLRTTRTTLVTPEMMRSLVALKEALQAERKDCEPPPAPGEAPGKAQGEMTLFDTRFRLADRPGYHYEMDPVDLAEILKSIRQGKQHSDLLIATIHAHEEGIGCEEPGDFLPVLAHAAIDAGADAFIGHGVHQLRPIEIYKGRPIFYSLANFFWSDIQEPIPADLYQEYRGLLAEAFGDPEKATDADLSALLNADEFNDERYFQSVIAVSRFEKGRAIEIRLYPIDLGYGMKLTKSGVPHLASPGAARAILERLQRNSRPYGTTITIEQNTGVIRPH